MIYLQDLISDASFSEPDPKKKNKLLAQEAIAAETFLALAESLNLVALPISTDNNQNVFYVPLRAKIKTNYVGSSRSMDSIRANARKMENERGN